MPMKLDEAAELLQVHPRTVLRAIAGEVNTYWAPGHNPDVKLEEVSEAFGFEPIYMKRARGGKDAFLKPQEAADFVEMRFSTFRHRRPPKIIDRPGVVRYSRRDVATWALEI